MDNVKIKVTWEGDRRGWAIRKRPEIASERVWPIYALSGPNSGDEKLRDVLLLCWDLVEHDDEVMFDFPERCVIWQVLKTGNLKKDLLDSISDPEWENMRTIIKKSAR